MRAPLLSLAVLLVVTATAPAAAGPAGVRMLECTPALEPAARSATFEARVRRVRGSETMAMRFSLQSRAPDGLQWRHLKAEGFDAWLTSQPGVRRYTYAKTVRALPVPAGYRVLVRFRWLGPEGEVLARARALSSACAQPDLRPDLVARRVDVLPAPEPGLRRYGVLIRNAGGGDAPATVLRLELAGGASLAVAVPPLREGDARTLHVTAPACAAGTRVTAIVDATDLVAERDEAGNALAVSCPA